MVYNTPKNLLNPNQVLFGLMGIMYTKIGQVQLNTFQRDMDYTQRVGCLQVHNNRPDNPYTLQTNSSTRCLSGALQTSVFPEDTSNFPTSLE